MILGTARVALGPCMCREGKGLEAKPAPSSSSSRRTRMDPKEAAPRRGEVQERIWVDPLEAMATPCRLLVVMSSPTHKAGLDLLELAPPPSRSCPAAQPEPVAPPPPPPRKTQERLLGQEASVPRLLKQTVKPRTRVLAMSSVQ